MGEIRSRTSSSRVIAGSLVLMLLSLGLAVTLSAGDSARAIVPPFRGFAAVDRFEIETKSIVLPDTPIDSAVDVERGVVYVSVMETDEVVEVDLETGNVVASHFVPNPAGLDLSSDGSHLYVALNQSTGIARIDLSDWSWEQVVLPLLEYHLTWDVVEISPGVVVVSADPSSMGSYELTRYDFNTGVQDQVATNHDLGSLPRIDPTLATGNGDLYVGSMLESLARIDLSTPQLDIVASVRSADLGAGNQIAVSPHGGFLVTASGQKADVETLTPTGTFPEGYPLFSDDGTLLYSFKGILPGDALVTVSDAATGEEVVEWLADCGIEDRFGWRDTTFTKGEGSPILVGTTQNALCLMDTRQISPTVPTTTTTLNPPTSLPPKFDRYVAETINVPLGSSVFDVEVDPDRGVAYASLQSAGELLEVDLETGEILARRAFERPVGLELAADGDHLYVALDGEGSVAYVDLDDWSRTDIELPSLGDPRTWDVVEVSPGVMLASSNGPTLGYIARYDLSTGEEDRVADGSLFPPGARLELDPGKALYIGQGWSDNPLWRLDLASPQFDLVLEDNGNLQHTREIAVHPGGDFVVIGSGQKVATDTFVVVGSYVGGSQLFSDDGRVIYSLNEGVGIPTHVAVSNSATTQKLAEWEVDCGDHIPRWTMSQPRAFTKVPGSDTLVAATTDSLCLIDTSSVPEPPLPPPPTTTTTTTTLPPTPTTTPTEATTTTTTHPETTTPQPQPPTPPARPENTFGDDDGHVFEKAIEAIAAVGITEGCDPPRNSLFCPDDFVTRGQMAVFLARALHLTTDAEDDLFIDDDGHFYETAAERLAIAEITRGCNPSRNDRFCGGDLITRGQMAAFVVRSLGYTDDGGGDLFTDDDDSIFEKAIDKLGAAGVTQGCDPPTNERFCPDGFVTRGQMAAFLTRALGLRS